MTADGGELFASKGRGLVRDVFSQRDMDSLRGNIGIGHVRYPTAGGNSASEVQPFYVNAPYGICLAHNGNLTNSAELTAVLMREDRRHLNTRSDSEVLLNVFASELQRIGTPRATPVDIFAAVNAVYRRCRGAYAVVAMIIGHGILGFRDPHGIRPLVLGQRRTARGMEYMLASESVALTMLQFEVVRDVAPARRSSSMNWGACIPASACRPCATRRAYSNTCISRGGFHHRQHLGVPRPHAHGRAPGGEGQARASGPRHRRGDPIPDTSRTCALQLAQRLRIKYREGFNKNRYIAARSSCRARQRQKSVRRKLSAIDLEFRGKNVLLVDDSIVRARPRRRSSSWPATPAQTRCISLLPRRLSSTRMCMASTCLRLRSWSPPGAVSMKWRGRSAPTGWSTRIWMIWYRRAATTTPRSPNSTPRASPGNT